MIRHSPLYDVLSVLDSFNQATRLPMQSAKSNMGSNGETGWGMLIDCYATNDQAVVLAALPGIHPDDTNVSVDNDTLTITGNVTGGRKQQDEQGDQVTWYLSEIPRGSYERRITLPFQIDEEHVEAQFSNGMLRIVLPRLEASRPRQISVQVMENRFPEIAGESGDDKGKSKSDK